MLIAIYEKIIMLTKARSTPRLFMPTLIAGLTMLLAACTPAPAPHQKGGGKADPDIQVTQPGTATCITTSAQDSQTGASAANSVRARAGLAPLRVNDLLSKAAADHACDMAQRGRMTHQGSITSGPAQRVKSLGYAPKLTAENIAAGPFSLDRVLTEWNRSEGHLVNTLIPQTREFGIGQAIGTDGKTRFWAAVYAAPKN